MGVEQSVMSAQFASAKLSLRECSVE